MLKGSQTKPKEKNGFKKSSSTKKDSNKPNEQNQSNRFSKLLNSVPFNKIRHTVESPASTMSKDSSNISRHVRVTSFVSNNSMESSITEIGSKMVSEKLTKDVQDLRQEYQNVLQRLNRENNELKEEIKKNEREIVNYIKVENENLKKCVDQLDVELRIVNKSLYNLQSHYVKFVPFLIENVLAIMKNQEYLEQRVTELESPKSNESKIFQSLTSSYCNTPSSNSLTYSISISPVDEKDYYKLIFNPFNNICISKFNEVAKEQIYSIPVIKDIFINEKQPGSSIQTGPNSINRKILLGSKTIPYYLKRINNTENDIVSHSTINTNQRKCNYDNNIQYSTMNIKTLEDNFNSLSTFPKKIKIFKDLKRRHLKLKLKGLRCYTYPCVNTPTIDHDILGKVDVNSVFESEVEFETAKDDFNTNLCQSDTDMFGEKFQIISSTNSSDNYLNSKIREKRVLYQQIPYSVIKRLKTFNNETPYEKINENKSNEFSIILPRTKLSSLLSNNFSNISSVILSSNDENNMYLTSKETLKPNLHKPIKIDDSDYFTFISNEHTLNKDNLASFDSLSDEDSYIDDDYGQQILTNQHYVNPSSLMDILCDSFSDLDQFNLPNSSVNDIFSRLDE